MLSSPQVADDIVYIGSIDNNVYALDALNGRLIWKYKTGDNVVSSGRPINKTVSCFPPSINVL